MFLPAWIEEINRCYGKGSHDQEFSFIQHSGVKPRLNKFEQKDYAAAMKETKVSDRSTSTTNNG